jgi:ADP-heptose:LPS heptosyltransferase
VKQKQQNLVIYRLSAMGDVSMIVPLVLALRNQYQEVKITVVSNAFFQPFFQSMDNVDFIGIDTKKKHKGFFGIFKILKEIYIKKPTHFADLHCSLRSKIIVFLLKIVSVKSFTLHKGRTEKKALVRPKNKIFKLLKHTTSRYNEVFEKLGFIINLEKPYYLNIEKIPEKYIEIFSNNHKTIGIAPIAKHEAKTYPLELMKEVVEQLATNQSNYIFLFGGKNEYQALKSLKGNHVNISVVDCSFKEELALICNLNVMLSMDSGNAHLAAMYGIKTITIWGGTHPFAGFSPYFQPLENCIVPNVEKFKSLPNSVFGNKMTDEVKLAFDSFKPKVIVEKLM